MNERLEALAQSVELLTHDMHELQKLNKDNQVLAGKMTLAITRAWRILRTRTMGI